MASEGPGEMGLLQDSVDQFEKDIEMKRTVLRMSIAKHERDLEESCSELAMKEEELAIWEERAQQIQKDNEIKFCLAKARSDKWRGKGKATLSAGATALGFIAEGDEPDCFAEGDTNEDDEEDAQLMQNESKAGNFLRDDNTDANPAKRGGTLPVGVVESETGAVEKQPHPGAEAANALADIVVGELAILQKQLQELVSGVDSLTGVGSPIARAPDGQVMGTLLHSIASLGQTGRMKLKQRIESLQGDILTAADRNLQECGAPSGANRRSSSASVSGTASASTSAGSTPVMASTGPKVTAADMIGSSPGRVEVTPHPGRSASCIASAPTRAGSTRTPVIPSTGSKVMAAGTTCSSPGRAELISRPVSSLHTPAQARVGNVSFPAPIDSNTRLGGAANKSGGQVPTPLRPTCTNGIQDSPSPKPGPLVMPVKGPGTASPRASPRSAGFRSVSSHMRCVSPLAMKPAQVSRSRPQQLISGRALTSMSPTIRSAETSQRSVSCMSSNRCHPPLLVRFPSPLPVLPAGGPHCWQVAATAS